MQSSPKQDKGSVFDQAVDFAKTVPFVQFVVGGTLFAVIIAFSLFALQYYIFYGVFLPPLLIIAGIITPLLTAFVCFYFTALIIKKLIYAEKSLEAHNATLQERVSVEVEKRRDKERLLLQQSKMALMGEMMCAIAHQWRQPLNALGIFIQDTRYAYQAGEMTGEYIDKFLTDSMNVIKFMSKTIDNFRNFFSVDKEKKEFCLEDSIDSVLNIVGAEVINGGIKVDFGKSGRHFIIGFESEFKQVLLNLISNAKDAICQTNPENKAISIKVLQADGLMSVSVEDSGGGVDEGIIDRIFEPYFTTKEPGKGVGVGLYMSKQIIEREMNGSLYVENGAEGAKFIIKFC